MGHPDNTTLDGEFVTLRRTVPDYASRLLEIFSEPAITEWWGHWDLAKVQRKKIDRDDDTVLHVVHHDGVTIGLVQYTEEHDPDDRHASIDIALHPDWHGRGLGSDTIRTPARHLFAQRGHHRITIDPAAHNHRAIRSCERVAFRPVGVMRRYERGPDGTWHGGLLMDLLWGELI